MNLCRECGEDFASVAAFDAHRVGRHAHTFREGLAMDPPREDGRRCLDPGELENGGWQRDTRGRWLRPADRRRALKHAEGVAYAQRGAAGRSPSSDYPRALADPEKPDTQVSA
jgi:hypothetical protein